MFWYSLLFLGGLGLAASLLVAIFLRLFRVKEKPLAESTPEIDEARTRTTVWVRCSGGSRARNRFSYEGLHDCLAAMRLGGGQKDCAYACIGLGSCVKECPSGALSLVDDIAVSDTERCTSCKKCAKICPKGIISEVPYDADVHIPCSSKDKEFTVRKLCDIGCLACNICLRVCKNDAIKVIDNHASIDFEKCSGCGDCAEKCPRKLITDTKLDKGPRLMESHD